MPDSELLARIDEKVIRLDQWAKEHAQDDASRFERTFKFVKESFDKIDDRFDKVDAKLETLWDGDNQRRGGEKMKKFIYTAAMSILALIAGYFGGSHKP